MIAIDSSKCTGCGACLAVCPYDALSLTSGRLNLDVQSCRSCGLCIDVCPVAALQSVSPVVVPTTEARVPVGWDEIRIASLLQRSVWREQMLPVVSVVAGFAARQLLPLIVDRVIARARPVSIARLVAGAVVSSAAGQRRRFRGRS